MKRREYTRILREARARHDARFAIDHPKPTAEQVGQALAFPERLAGYLWVVWLALAVAGAIISAPHTLATLRAALPGATEIGLVIYSVAGFAGIEAGLVGLALVSALNRRDMPPRKVWSIKGLVNAWDVRLGNAPRHDLSHLPDRTPAGGVWLITGLFLAALVFNQVDTLRDVLDPHQEAAQILSRAVVGVLGPGLLLVSGHRFAFEVVWSSRRARYRRLADVLGRWEQAKQMSWDSDGDAWIEVVQCETTVSKQGETSTKQPVRVPGQNGTPTEQPKRVPEHIERTVRAFQDAPGMSLTELAGMFDVARSTAQRWASQAADLGLLKQDGKGQPYYAPNGSRAPAQEGGRLS